METIALAENFPARYIGDVTSHNERLNMETWTGLLEDESYRTSLGA